MANYKLSEWIYIDTKSVKLHSRYIYSAQAVCRTAAHLEIKLSCVLSFIFRLFCIITLFFIWADHLFTASLNDWVEGCTAKHLFSTGKCLSLFRKACCLLSLVWFNDFTIFLSWKSINNFHLKISYNIFCHYPSE